MKIKDLEFYDEPKNYYGRVPRSTAIIDTWGLEGIDRYNGRKFIRYDVYEGNDNNLHAFCAALDLKADVGSIEEGKKLCNEWNRKYWTEHIEHIKKYILDPVPADDNLETDHIVISTTPTTHQTFTYALKNKDDQLLIEGYGKSVETAWNTAYKDFKGIKNDAVRSCENL